MKKISNKKTYTFTVGRRKSSSARVRLFKGTGESLINGQKVSSIYQNKINELSLNKPFKVTDTLGKFYFTANVTGGGKEGQLEAIVHGISRALVKLDSEKY
ncbi:MAG: 30S ribosomal protein S9, partial [Candidatus Woesebacteria bacterium]|nr:30S ribosomal protein S9 [Candidatus Woesebacteria bacterium]